MAYGFPKFSENPKFAPFKKKSYHQKLPRQINNYFFEIKAKTIVRALVLGYKNIRVLSLKLFFLMIFSKRLKTVSPERTD